MTRSLADRSLGARLAAAGLDWIVPEWPAPAQICALSTTRRGHAGPCDLSLHETRDEASHAELRRWVPAEPLWLAQVHGATICDADSELVRRNVRPQADGAFARSVGAVCAVLCADCLPVLFTDTAGSVVGAAHAGWRGLAAGVLEATLAAMRSPPRTLLAWLGPAIGPASFEVGRDVLRAHCEADAGAAACFVPHGEGKWLADLYALARRRLLRAGLSAIYGGGRCTLRESSSFYSYRREGRSAGRMATLIWISSP